MKKIVTFLIFLILMTTSTIIYANLPTKTITTRENLIEDTVIINEELSKELLIEEAFLRSISGEISKAIKDNYEI